MAYSLCFVPCLRTYVLGLSATPGRLAVSLQHASLTNCYFSILHRLTLSAGDIGGASFSSIFMVDCPHHEKYFSSWHHVLKTTHTSRFCYKSLHLCYPDEIGTIVRRVRPQRFAAELTTMPKPSTAATDVTSSSTTEVTSIHIIFILETLSGAVDPSLGTKGP